MVYTLQWRQLDLSTSKGILGFSSLALFGYKVHLQREWPIVVTMEVGNLLLLQSRSFLSLFLDLAATPKGTLHLQIIQKKLTQEWMTKDIGWWGNNPSHIFSENLSPKFGWTGKDTVGHACVWLTCYLHATNSLTPIVNRYIWGKTSFFRGTGHY